MTGWCLDMYGLDQNTGAIHRPNSAASARECLGECRREGGAKGCEYVRTKHGYADCKIHTEDVIVKAGDQGEGKKDWKYHKCFVF